MDFEQNNLGIKNVPKILILNRKGFGKVSLGATSMMANYDNAIPAG